MHCIQSEEESGLPNKMTIANVPQTLIDVLTEIQSIYDSAVNHILFLRLQWPSSSPIWRELAQLAESLTQGRESFDTVLLKTIAMREAGVEIPIQGTSCFARSALLRVDQASLRYTLRTLFAVDQRYCRPVSHRFTRPY